MIILVTGFMGAGKSTVGQIIAEKLGYQFVEFDKKVLEKTGFESIAKVYANKKSLWKEIELEVSRELSKEKNLVIACGGGFFDNDLNVLYFKENAENLKIIYLKADAETLATRNGKVLKNDIETVRIKKNIELIFLKRDLLYSEFSDITVETSEKDPVEIAELLIKDYLVTVKLEALHLYEMLFLLMIDEEHKFVSLKAMPYVNYLLLIAVLMELYLEEKILFTPTGIEIVEHWYVPKDSIIRKVFYSITSPADEFRLGTDLHKLVHFQDQNLLELIISSMSDKGYLNLVSKPGFFFNTHQDIVVNLPYLKSDLLKKLLKKDDIKIMVLLWSLKVAKLLKDSKQISVYEDYQLKNKEILKQLSLLEKEFYWAAEYFAF